MDKQARHLLQASLFIVICSVGLMLTNSGLFAAGVVAGVFCGGMVLCAPYEIENNGDDAEEHF